MQRTTPYDAHDQADLAEEAYNDRVRSQNRALADENLKLKRLLRSNGISWTPSLTFDPQSVSPVYYPPAPGRRASSRNLRSRASVSGGSGGSNGTDQKPKMPHLPMEVQLRILQYALTSDHPIIDPLSKLEPHNVTTGEMTVRKNQIAIGFLATCSVFRTEGARVLWGNNSFVFTTHTALRNFAELDLRYRNGIKSVTLRIIAKFYDEKEVKRSFGTEYHPSLRTSVPLKVNLRPRELGLAYKGFRVYAWCQIIDFLNALAPPHYAGCDKSQLRPRLFPNLEAMRIDFVNFIPQFLPLPDHFLHEVAAHDNGCTLNELMITGLPCSPEGLRGGYELAGMVRDNGLFVDAVAAFVQRKKTVRTLPAVGMEMRVMRSWRVSDNEPADEHAAHTGCYGKVAPAPSEPDAPASAYVRPTVWKRVPVSRDSQERKWMEFDRQKGLNIDQMLFQGYDMDREPDSDDEDDIDVDDEDGLLADVVICNKCGDVHPYVG